MIVNNTTTDRLLACIIQKPQILLDSQYKLDKNEFKGNKFHQIVFITCYNLAINGCKTITIFDINEFLKPYSAQYQVYLDNNGDDYISTIIELVDEENFNYYYEQFKKFSCLNTYKEEGFNVDKFYDETKTEDSQLENLNQYSVEDIINHYEGKQEKIKSYFTQLIAKAKKGGVGFRAIKERFKETPYFGAIMCSPIQTALYRGWCRGHLLSRSAPSGFGKAQPINTIIPTPNGNKRLGELNVGDYVFDKNGKPTKVLSIHPQGVIDCYKVIFRDGRETYCNGEHLWNIYTSHHSKCKTTTNKTLNEIITLMEKDTISIPICDKVQYSEKNFNIDPYIIGSFLGNGCCKEKYLSLSSNDIEQVVEISRIGNFNYKKNSEFNYTWSFKDKNGHLIKTSEYFKGLDGIEEISKNKFIPKEYKYGSVEQRYSLLQGLFDTDGSITKNFDISYSTTSIKLANDIREVLNSLGYFCNIHKENRKNANKNECYVLTITLDNKEKELLFRLSRKKQIAINAKSENKRRDYNRLSFKKIEKVDPCEMVCIYVDNEEHLYLTNDYIVTHNTILSVGELCNVCVTEMYDEEVGDFVINPNYQNCGGLFINTEMDLETELEPMFVAWIANVSRSSIMDGVYESEEEEARVDRAIEIFEESNIFLVDDPKFTLASLESTIKQYSLNENVGYVVFDYLQDNGIIGKEMRKTHEVVARDTIILNMAESLKTWARMYNVGIYTSTQLNGNEKTQDIIDEGCLSGGKALKNKLDAGNIIMYPRKKELIVYDKIDKTRGFGNQKITPNLISHNYKVRFGKYGTNIKIYQYADLGTGRIKDLCCTNVLNQPLNVETVSYQ